MLSLNFLPTLSNRRSFWNKETSVRIWAPLCYQIHDLGPGLLAHRAVKRESCVTPRTINKPKRKELWSRVQEKKRTKCKRTGAKILPPRPPQIVSSTASRPEVERPETQNSLELSVTGAGQPGTITDARPFSGHFKWRETRLKTSGPCQPPSLIPHHLVLPPYFTPLGKSSRMKRFLQHQGYLENRTC